MSDRTVHASHGDEKLVRYDRQGKWFVEFSPANLRPARRVHFAAAVDIAKRMKAEGGRIYLHKPGGSAFDRAVVK